MMLGEFANRKSRIACHLQIAPHFFFVINWHYSNEDCDNIALGINRALAGCR